MRGRRSRLARLTFASALLAVVAVVLPASASATRALYASGHPFDTDRFAQFGGNTLVATFNGCSDSEWSSALMRTDFDVLIVGENAPGCLGSLSPTTLDSIRNYVNGGHRYIETGAHNHQDEFLAAVFGFTITNTQQDSSETLTGSLQPGAAGTPFAGGPAALTPVNQTDLVGSTPGTAIYSGPEGTYVFTVPFGGGVVTYLAWDLCGTLDSCGTDPAKQDDWYRVLDRAAKVTNGFTIDATTRNKKKGTATITGHDDFPGELIASGNGVKASSADGAVISKSVGAGQQQLLVKAKGKKKRKLNKKGKVQLSLVISYTAKGGSPQTQSLNVKLKKKLPKKR